QEPKDPDVVGGLIREGVEGPGVALDARPIAGKKIQTRDEQAQREHHEPGREHPAQIRVYFVEDFVRIPRFEAYIEDARLIDAAFALVANSFEHGEILLAYGTLPHGRLDAIEKIKHLRFGERLGGMALVERLGDFGGSASAVAEREKLIFRSAIAIVRVRFEDFDDVACFAGNGLLADAHIGAHFRAPQTLCENAGDLQASGAEAHRWNPLRPAGYAGWAVVRTRPTDANGHARAQIGKLRSGELCDHVVAVACGVDGRADLDDSRCQRPIRIADRPNFHRCAALRTSR